MATADAGATLIVFARRPRVGGVKTRLARSVGTRQAAWIYQQLLLRTIAVAEGVRVARRILMPAAPDDTDWFASRFSARGWRVEAQCGGHLGVRMADAVQRFGNPAGCVLIGSDIANLDRGALEGALAALRDPGNVVLGPAADGGYWLVGSRANLDPLFADLAWGTSTVLAQTLERSRQAGLAARLLAPRHDIDGVGDLRYWRDPAARRFSARGRVRGPGGRRGARWRARFVRRSR